MNEYFINIFYVLVSHTTWHSIEIALLCGHVEFLLTSCNSSSTSCQVWPFQIHKIIEIWQLLCTEITAVITATQPMIIILQKNFSCVNMSFIFKYTAYVCV